MKTKTRKMKTPIDRRTIYPLKNESRYSITQEFCGDVSPRYVLRFCGDFVAASAFLSSLVTRAVGHNHVRLGYPVISEIPTDSKP